MFPAKPELDAAGRSRSGRTRRIVARTAVLGFALLALLLAALWYVASHRDAWLLAALPGDFPEVVYFFPTDRPLVALTIDDAPDPRTTPAILDLLAEHQAAATFFIISDRVAGNEALIERMAAEGHEIGNHMTADEMSVRLSPEEFARKLRGAHDALSPYAAVRWFRPASGWFNGRMIEQMRQLDYRLAMGSVFPFDTHLDWPGFSSWLVRTRSGPGSVIVLHDGGERGANTHAALAEILPALRAQGLAAVTLSELLAATQGQTPELNEDPYR
jgi:peptidoglycan/xylan/chitin deacetylase (PgdA/CDA1 family)